MPGYFQKAEESARVLRDGWLDTGDLGYWHKGELVITGRAKDLIIVNGRNIWPQDIEWAVEALPQVGRGDACAFSVDGDTAEAIVVIVEAYPSEPDGARGAGRRHQAGREGSRWRRQPRRADQAPARPAAHLVGQAEPHARQVEVRRR